MAGAVIVGAGPLIGTSVARRLAREGMPVVVIARSPDSLRDALAPASADSGEISGLLADVTDDEAIRSALDDAARRNGVPEVALYNAAMIRADRLGELSATELLDTLAVNAVGAMVVGAHLAESMVDAGGGTLLFTGGMPHVKPGVASLSLGKAALRTVADLFQAEYGSRGLHVATVTVHDVVAPGTPYDPDLIADAFVALHREQPDAWTHETQFQRRLGPQPREPSQRWPQAEALPSARGRCAVPRAPVLGERPARGPCWYGRRERQVRRSRLRVPRWSPSRSWRR